MDEKKAAEALKLKLADREWRLNNLYWIIDKEGRKIKFQLNWAQKWLLDHLWYMNLILKARQLGMTTFICILFLDTALFKSNTQCGIVAHNREDAEEFFSNKVKYAYDNLPEWLRAERTAPSDSAKKLAFSNGSSIRVGTSLRSGTFQFLLISEFGKVCARFPGKAQEIVTGALNTVQAGQFVFIESTAEGREGYFHDYCMEALARQQAGKHPNEMQFLFHFFPWWKEPAYTLEPDGVLISPELQKYFLELEGQGITLDAGQKAWYVEKHRTQRDDMMREYPATPEEAFKASIEGAYYGADIAEARRKGRIGKVPVNPHIPVNTFWDIGYNDQMAIWFMQRVGAANHLIDYYENTGEGLAHYAKVLKLREYHYGTHYLPHDGKNGSAQTGQTFDQFARGLGISPLTIVPRARDQEQVLEGIEAVRGFLAVSFIDEEKCAQGIKCLENYRKEWDGNLGCYKRTPLHNWASNGADALRTGSVGYNGEIQVRQEDLLPVWHPDF